jgi:hypothetical protein
MNTAAFAAEVRDLLGHPGYFRHAKNSCERG